MQVQVISTVSALISALIAALIAGVVAAPVGAAAPTVTIDPAEPPAGTIVAVQNPALTDNAVCTVWIDQINVSDCSQLAPGDRQVVVRVPPDAQPGTHTLAMKWYEPESTSPAPSANPPPSEPTPPPSSDSSSDDPVLSAPVSLLLDEASSAEMQFVVPEWHLDEPTDEELTSGQLLEVTGRGFAPGGECSLTILEESAACRVDDAGVLSGAIDLPAISTITELQLDATNLIRADLTQSDSLILVISPPPAAPTTTVPTTSTGEPTSSSTDSSPGETPSPTSSQTTGVQPTPAGPTETPRVRPVAASGTPWLSLGLAIIAVLFAAALLLRNLLSSAATPTVRVDSSATPSDRLQVRAPASPADLSLRVKETYTETSLQRQEGERPWR
jgi:hypothetical protein